MPTSNRRPAIGSRSEPRGCCLVAALGRGRGSSKAHGHVARPGTDPLPAPASPIEPTDRPVQAGAAIFGARLSGSSDRRRRFLAGRQRPASNIVPVRPLVAAPDGQFLSAGDNPGNRHRQESLRKKEPSMPVRHVACGLLFSTGSKLDWHARAERARPTPAGVMPRAGDPFARLAGWDTVRRPRAALEMVVMSFDRLAALDGDGAARVVLTRDGRRLLAERARLLRARVLPELRAALEDPERDGRVDADYARAI